MERHSPAEASKVSDTSGLQGFLHRVLKVNIRTDMPHLSNILTFQAVLQLRRVREDVCNDNSILQSRFLFAHVLIRIIHVSIPVNLVGVPAPLPKRTNQWKQRRLPTREESRNVAATALGWAMSVTGSPQTPNTQQLKTVLCLTWFLDSWVPRRIYTGPSDTCMYTLC